MKKGSQTIEIGRYAAIPSKELRFTFSRSSGPGGQNVNKVNTRATLHFDVEGSKALTAEQKAIVKKRLASRLTRNGVLLISSDRHRSQHANRQETIRTFERLLAEALRPKVPRKKRSVPKAAKERRLRAKRHRSKIKRLRAKKGMEWD